MPRQISDMRRHALCSAIQIWTACVPALTESSVMLPKHPCLHWPCCNAWRYRKPDCFRVIDEGDMQAAASLRSSSRSMRCELHPALHLLNVWDGEVQQTSGLQGQSAYRFAAWVTQGLAIRNVGNGRWMAASDNASWRGHGICRLSCLPIPGRNAMRCIRLRNLPWKHEPLLHAGRAHGKMRLQGWQASRGSDGGRRIGWMWEAWPCNRLPGRKGAWR